MKNEDLSEMLTTALRAEPDYTLPSNFALKMTLSIARKERWKINLSDYAYLVASLLFLLLITSGVYYLADKDLLFRTWSFLKSNLLPVTLILFTLNFILLADRVLLPYLFDRRKTN